MKRLLQYSCLCAKNNHSIFRLLASRSRAHFTSSLLYSFSYLISPYQHVLPTCFLLRLLASRLCFSYLVPSTLLLTCSVSLACMYTIHSCSASCFHYRTCFPTVLVHFSSRASWLHAYSTWYLLLYALYLYSVLLGRAGSAVVLQRLPNIRCLLCLLCIMLYKLSYRIREWISDELRSHRGHREQHLCSVFVEDMRRGEEGFKNVACVGRGKKPSYDEVL